MKQAIALLLFCCSFCQCMLKLGVVAYYECNKQYIAANLCENRDKPQLKCCGKCYLKKQLRKADTAPQEGGPKTGLPLKMNWPESSPYVLPSLLSLVVHNPSSTPSPLLGYYRPMPLSSASAAVFHPPQA